MTARTEEVPVRIGIAGLGRMGMYHLERLSLRNDCRAVVCFDLLTSQCEAAEGFGCRRSASWRDFLDDETELVLIATPPATHASLAIEALAAGKHVAVETPLCLTMPEADAMLEAADRTGLLLSVVHHRRWDDDFQTAVAALQSGRLGHLQIVSRVVWEYGFPTTSRSFARTGWRADSDCGGGALIEFGAHYFDQLLQLVPDPVSSVFAQIPGADTSTSKRLETITPDVKNVENAFLAVVTFAGGLSARIDVNLASPVPLDTGWTLIGSDGGYRDFRRYELTEDGEVFDTSLDSVATDWDQYYAGIVGHLREGSAPPVTAEQARRVVGLIEATRRSAQSGQVVCVNECPQ